MHSKIEIYAAIEGAIEYHEDWCRHQSSQLGIEYVPVFSKSTATYLTYISSLNQELLNNISVIGGVENVKILNTFRNLAAFCVLCLEFNGGCDRSDTSSEAVFLEPTLQRRRVFKMIESEVEYQNELEPSGLSISDHVIRFQHFLNEAYSDLVTKPGDEYCLSTIRILAGVCVQVMEQHGVMYPDPFEVC